jgi:hypothetical protein
LKISSDSVSPNLSKDKFRNLCQKEITLPLFLRDWWLDTVCGVDGWDVAIATRDNQIVGALPYSIKTDDEKVTLSTPQETKFLGPWVKDTGARYAKALTKEKKILEELITDLPHFHNYSQNWHHKATNWLPFLWNNFKQTTFYTYIIDDLTNIDFLWNETLENVKTDIRKAKTKFELTVSDMHSIKDFIRLNNLTFERQGKKPPYEEDFVLLINEECIKRNCGKCFFAEDKEGNLHSAVYIVWDENSAYYLWGGSDPQFRNSGANSYCLWEAIKFSASVTKAFDFEGSMIKPFEKFFRAFGGKLTPYFNVYKKNPHT